MMCGIGNHGTPNLFVRKLIMLLFLVPFILIKGDISVHGHNGEIGVADALIAPNSVHFQIADDENGQHSDDHPRLLRRRCRQQHVMSDSSDTAETGASFKNKFPPTADASSATEHKYRIENVHWNDSKEDAVMVNYDGYEYNEKHTIDKNVEKILSRRRRYLIFPPGSSVQIVYDTYHPIIDYSNYLILGITAALAWELPSKPVYLDEELRDSFQMGNLPLLKRKDQNVSPVNYANTTKDPSQSPSLETNANAYSNYYYTNLPNKQNPFNRYYAVNPNHRFSYVPNGINGDDAGQSNKLQYYLSYADRLMKEFKQLTQNIPKDRPFGPASLKDLADTLTKTLAPASKKKFNSPPLRKHLVHPVFKRREIEKMDELEKYDLKLHRTTRHKLYQQIEKFLKTQGSDGMDCVLKTLCETGQRDTSEKPGSMIVELLRAVFTLPQGSDRVEDPKHRMYDRAHQSKKNCNEMFPACAESIWGPKFHY